MFIIKSHRITTNKLFNYCSRNLRKHLKEYSKKEKIKNLRKILIEIHLISLGHDVGVIAAGTGGAGVGHCTINHFLTPQIKQFYFFVF